MKISGMVFAVLLISVFVVFYTVMLNEANNNYNINVSSETLSKIDEFDKHSYQLVRINETADTLTGEKQGSSVTDLLGGLFQSGYNALLTMKDSVSTTTSIASQGADELGLDSQMSTIIKTIIVGIIIAAFVFAIIGILIRKENL